MFSSSTTKQFEKTSWVVVHAFEGEAEAGESPLAQPGLEFQHIQGQIKLSKQTKNLKYQFLYKTHVPRNRSQGEEEKQEEEDGGGVRREWRGAAVSSEWQRGKGLNGTGHLHLQSSLLVASLPQNSSRHLTGNKKGSSTVNQWFCVPCKKNNSSH